MNLKQLAVFLVAVLHLSASVAVENFPDSHTHHHDAVIGHSHSAKNIKKTILSDVYACNLYDYSKQCREYEILEGAKTTLSEIQEGCESMGGSFSAQRCPSNDILGECRDIIRNYHQPDVIYLNKYYHSETEVWTLEIITRVCGDLGGELFN